MKLWRSFFSGKSDIHILTFSDSVKFADNIPHADLYLLDVKMPEVSGMDLAQKIRSMDLKCSIIFISSLYEPVFDSFRYTPLRYIRKEYLEEELPSALSSFLEMKQRTCRTLPVVQNGLEIFISLLWVRCTLCGVSLPPKRIPDTWEAKWLFRRASAIRLCQTQ